MSLIATLLFSAAAPVVALIILYPGEKGKRLADLMPGLTPLNIVALSLLPALGVGLYLCNSEADWLWLWQNDCLFFACIVASVMDIRKKMIPNTLVLVMLAVWMLFASVVLMRDPDANISWLLRSLLGFLLGGGLFLIVYFLSKKGLGGGDVKFMAAAGLYLTVDYVLPAILYGTVLAGLTGLAMILTKRMGRRDSLPLAPFLTIGIILSIFVL